MNSNRSRENEAATLALLPREGAFVVQVRADSRLDTRQICGRVEHVASGAADSFQDSDTLLAFVIRTLRQEAGFEDGSDDLRPSGRKGGSTMNG